MWRANVDTLTLITENLWTCNDHFQLTSFKFWLFHATSSENKNQKTTSSSPNSLLKVTTWISLCLGRSKRLDSTLILSINGWKRRRKLNLTGTSANFWLTKEGRSSDLHQHKSHRCRCLVIFKSWFQIKKLWEVSECTSPITMNCKYINIFLLLAISLFTLRCWIIRHKMAYRSFKTKVFLNIAFCKR